MNVTAYRSIHTERPQNGYVNIIPLCTSTEWVCNLFLPPANEVWGKVMFLHVSVILSPEGGGLHPEGVCIQGRLPTGGFASVGSASREGVYIWGEWADPPPPELEKRAVHILLECFLV